LTTGDAARGVAMNEARRVDVDGRTYWTMGGAPRGPASRRVAHLLPIYDEYLIAYRDRAAVPHAPSTLTSKPGEPVTFQHALVIDGQVAGTWRTMRQAQRVLMRVFPLRRLSSEERRAIGETAERYERFLSVPVERSLVAGRR
jgi:hypothetical protein